MTDLGYSEDCGVFDETILPLGQRAAIDGTSTKSDTFGGTTLALLMIVECVIRQHWHQH